MSQVTVVRDYKKHTYNLAIGAAESSKEVAIDPGLGIKGEVVKLVVVVPDWTNVNITTVISLINADGKEIFATASMAENDEYDITLDSNECIILGQTGEKWKATLSGVPGGTEKTVIVTPYVEG